MQDQSETEGRVLPLWAHALDVLTIATAIFGMYLLIHGGFRTLVGPFRLSLKSGWRPLLWAAGVAVLRHLLVTRPTMYRSVAAHLMAASRASGALADDLTLFGRARRPVPAIGRAGVTGAAIVAVLLLFAGLTALMTYPQVRQMHSVTVDTADPLLSTWRLSWLAHQLPRDPLHLYDANIFFPERNTLAYSDAMVVPSLMIAPLVWSGVHPVVAYNLLLLSGFALSGAAMVLLMWSLTRQVGAALFAGFVFAFLPYRFMHYAHLELQMSLWMPLCLWALHRTVNGGRMRDGLLAGLFFALQTLSSWYYGIFFATFLVPVGAALLIGAGSRCSMVSVRPLVAGVLLAGLIVAPSTVPYLKARELVGERPMSEIQFYSATPTNYFAAHPRNALFGSVTAGLGGQERELFMGIGVPLIALVGLWPPMSAARIGYATGLLLAFELSLGLNGILYAWFHAYVLPYRGLRVPARMGMVVGLSLAILGGFGVARISSCFSSRRRAWAAVAILLLVAFSEYRSRLTLDRIWPDPPQVYAALPADHSAVVVELPFVAPDVTYEPAYMYFSTFDWHKMVNGYSGFSPPSYSRLQDVMVHFPDEASFAELRRHGVEFVIVHGAFYDPGDYMNITARLDARRELRLIDVSQWQRRETRLYRFVRTGSGG